MQIFGIGFTKEKILTVNKIIEYIENKTNKKINPEIIDLMSVDYPDVETPCIVFGGSVLPQLDLNSNNKEVFVFPSLPYKQEDVEKKRIAEKQATVLSEYLLQDKRNTEEKKEEYESYVEKENIKIGKVTADMIITEEEAEYLKKIKDILDGNKIVIKKGNLVIEVS